MGANHLVQGTNIVLFRLESAEILRASNLLWVIELMRTDLLVL
jgi:hypothetical protein